MKCPSCNETLLMSDKNGIEIDYCPSCRGIWLDRGELDKIIERSNLQDSSYDNNSNRPIQHDNRNQYDNRSSDRDYYKNNPYKKKKSFLSEIFDF